MPYQRLADLPDAVQEYPKKAQRIWMKAFNAAAKRYPKESQWFAVAWAALKKHAGKKC